MQGVTTALVVFILYCVISPERVKNRPQFYAAFAFVCLLVLLDALASAVGSDGFRVFVYFAIAAIQIGALLLLFMCAGGLSWTELKDDMTNAYEVIRRGGEEKEIIIPLSGQKAKRPDDEDDGCAAPIRIDDPSMSGPTSEKKPDSPSIPLE